MFSSRKLRSAEGLPAVVVPEAVSFDGVSDYLERTTQLTGAFDSKTFTASFWVYNADTTGSSNFVFGFGESGHLGSNNTLYCSIDGDKAGCYAYSSAGTFSLNAQSASAVPKNTWCHIIFSMDLSDTAKRHVYINDNDAAGTWATYLNNAVDLTVTDACVNALALANQPNFTSRQAHLFFDTTYRDLSIVSNRRSFISDEGLPVDIPLPTPIYVDNGFSLLPNSNGASDIAFDGTNYYVVVNGSDDVDVYNSSGVYQSNWAISAELGAPKGIIWDGTYIWVMDTAPDSLRKYNTAGVYQSETFTTTESGTTMDLAWDGTYFYVLDYQGKVQKYNTSGTWIEEIDLSSYIRSANGLGGIAWNEDYSWFYVADNVGSGENGTCYIFNSSFVLQDSFTMNVGDASETGLGWDGTNLISINFTSDFARKYSAAGVEGQIGGYPIGLADGTTGSAVEGDANYLKKTGGLTGAVDSKTFTTSMWVWIDPASGFFYPYTSIAATGFGKHATFVSPTNSTFQGRNAAGTLLLNQTNFEVPVGQWAHVIVSCDMSDTAKRHAFVNGVDATPTWGTYTNDFINFNHGIDDWIGTTDGTETKDGRIAHLYHDYAYRDLTDPNILARFFAGEGQQGPSQATLPEAEVTLVGGGVGTDFDGSTDYLNKTADLTSNADGKNFTFSAWALNGNLGYIYNALSSRFLVRQASSNKISCLGMNSAGTIILNFATAADALPQDNIWHHLAISCDMSNSSNRYVFVDGVDITSGVTWTTYTDDSIDFTRTDHSIGGSTTGTNLWQGRLAQVFLDYTYRNLSTGSELAKFYAGYQQPATGQAALSPIVYLPLSDDFVNDGSGGAFSQNGTPSQAVPAGPILYMPLIDDFLNDGTGGSSFTETGTVVQGETDLPILYLPMTDAATAGDNSGSGGNFTINGDPQTSSRGPNQDNCVASDINGSTDYVNFTSANSISGKVWTISLNLKIDTDGVSDIIFEALAGASQYIRLENDFGTLRFRFINTSTNLFVTHTLAIGRNYNIAFSVDVSDTGKRWLYIDGVDVSPTWSTYTDIAYTDATPEYTVGATGSPANHLDGTIGEVWFDDVYTDLSVSNPFWDSANGHANSVRKVISDTGVTPLLALPMYGNDAGNNLGSEGDFTVGSGPFTGARGGSEFWARSVWNGLSASSPTYTNYLSKASVGGSASTTTATIIMAVKSRDATLGSEALINIGAASNFGIQTNSSERVLPRVNGVNSIVGNVGTITTTNWTLIAVTYDGTDAVLNVKLRDVAVDRLTAAYSSAIDMSGTCTILSQSGGPDFPGDIAMCYVVDSFVDMDDADTWAKFFDRLDYPRDLTQAIADGDIPTPLVYMKFEDPDDLGANAGTGGDFTVNGTIKSGADVGVT